MATLVSKQKPKQPAKVDQETDTCSKCGTVSGYHCLKCHKTFTKFREDEFLTDSNGKPFKAKRSIEQGQKEYQVILDHNLNCGGALLNPLDDS